MECCCQSLFIVFSLEVRSTNKRKTIDAYFNTLIWQYTHKTKFYKKFMLYNLFQTNPASVRILLLNLIIFKLYV